MSRLVSVLAVLLILAGFASLVFPWAMVGSIVRGEFEPAQLFYLVLMLLYAWAAIGYSVSYLRTKKVKRAYSIATVTGFTVWALVNAQAVVYLEWVEDRAGLFAAIVLLFLPIVLGIGVTRYLKRGIRMKLGGMEKASAHPDMKVGID